MAMKEDAPERASASESSFFPSQGICFLHPTFGSYARRRVKIVSGRGCCCKPSPYHFVYRYVFRHLAEASPRAAPHARRGTFIPWELGLISNYVLDKV